MKIAYCFILLYIYSSTLHGENFFLKNRESNEAIEYAHISNGQGIGTYSDSEGKFSIEESGRYHITHINFKDTVLLFNDSSNSIIYLNPVVISLKEVVVSLGEKSEGAALFNKPEGRFKNFYNYLNISSFELGTKFTNNINEVHQLMEVKLPVKFGVDEPVIKINIYEFKNNKPQVLIGSITMDQFSDRRRKESLVFDFSGQNLILDPAQDLFISVELVGYVQKKDLSFQKYEKFKDALGIKMRVRDSSLTKARVKNFKSDEWPSANYSDNDDREPALEVVFSR